MDDLSSRLLAAIEETERRATRTAEQDEWDESPHDRLRLVINDRYPPALYDDGECPRGPLLDVLSLADPSSVLCRCAADRRTVERFRRSETDYHPDAFRVMEETVRDLAEAYGLSDHQEGEE